MAATTEQAGKHVGESTNEQNEVKESHPEKQIRRNSSISKGSHPRRQMLYLKNSEYEIRNKQRTLLRHNNRTF